MKKKTKRPLTPPPPLDPRKALGNLSESLAAEFLTAQGLQIVAFNYSVRGGELDLVCLDGNTVVFVEVRSTRGSYLSGPEASVTPAKQRHVIHAATVFLAQGGLGNANLRFDVVALDHRTDPPALRWIKDAFRPDFSFHRPLRRRFSDS